MSGSLVLQIAVGIVLESRSPDRIDRASVIRAMRHARISQYEGGPQITSMPILIWRQLDSVTSKLPHIFDTSETKNPDNLLIISVLLPGGDGWNGPGLRPSRFARLSADCVGLG
jgi:hypothetical protein